MTPSQYQSEHDAIIKYCKETIKKQLRWEEWKKNYTKHEPEPVGSIVTRVLKDFNLRAEELLESVE